MSLSALTWKYIGSQSFASATVAAVLDSAFTLGTKTTYADGSTRTEGSGSAWTWTARRYQNAGTTEACYPLAPTNTLNLRHILAGAASLPSPNPTMASPDSAAANVLMANVVKNGGAFNAWNNAAPFTSGDVFGYWRVWPTSAGTGTVKLWESEEGLWLTVSTSTGTTYHLCFYTLDPESSSTTDGETDGKLYGMAVSGSAQVALGTSNSGTSAGAMFGNGALSGNQHNGIFLPGSATIQTIAPTTSFRAGLSTTATKTRSGSYARLPISMRSAAGAPNDVWIGRAREIFYFTQALSGQKQGTRQIVGTHESVASDCWILEG